MWNQSSIVGCGRIAVVLLVASQFQACGGDEFRAQGGTLQLNARLRADLGPSTGMSTGDFFADGTCPSGSTNTAECKLITPVRASLFAARDGQFPNRLRKSDFLWVAAEGFPELSYELVGHNVNIVSVDDPSEVFASNITAGTCHSFPMRHPESRNIISALEDVEFENLDAYIQQFDVRVRTCAAPTINTGVSESLDPVTTNCGEQSVASLYGGNPPPSPQKSPFCILNRGIGALFGDVSFSITPAAAPGHNLSDLWPGLDASSKALLPHLKTVPVDNTRTISRAASRQDAGEANDDGSTTYRYSWGVGVSGNKWSENFSANVFVTKVRVRRGPVGSGNFMTIDRLESGRTVCGTRNAAATEYDIPMCQPGTSRFFRTTPGYHFDTLVQGPVGDSDRLAWTAFVRIPATAPGPYTDLSLELDLTADGPTGTMGSGLMGTPGAIDLGSQRSGQQSSPAQSFLVSNYGVSSLWVQSVDAVGGNAAEFGTPLIYRVTSSGTPTGAPITAPLVLRGGSRFGIRLQPIFQNIGTKQTEVVVSFTDVRNTSQNIRLWVEAQSVSPSIHLQPANLVFNAIPGAGRFGGATARRAALLTNDGPVTFQRIGFTFSGPDAAEFRVLAAAYGLTLSDGSQPQTLGPGEDEVYRLGYFPPKVGESNAFLTVHTTEGDVRIQLHGWCEQSCEQPPELAIDPPRALPPVTKADVIYPRIKVKLWPFGTKKAQRADDKDR